MAQYSGASRGTDFSIVKANGHSGVRLKDPHQPSEERSCPSSDFTSADVLGLMEASAGTPSDVSDVFLVLPAMVTVATQTDDYDNEEDETYYIDLQSCSVPEIYGDRGLSSEAFKPSDELHLAEMDLDGGPDFEDELGRTVDFEYEEVTIFRTNVDQKIGLTLCYGSATDEITDIFVSEVDPLSIAGADGRIKEGDQILQINGSDVHMRQQAVRMFAESGPSITLLLARPSLSQCNDGIPDDCRRVDGYKSSGNSQNDMVLEGGGGFDFPSVSEDGFERRAEERDATINITALDEQLGSHSVTGAALESKIAELNEEMKKIRLKYQEIMVSHQTDQRLPELTDVNRSPRMVPRMGTRLDQLRQSHGTTESSGEPQLAHCEHAAAVRPSRKHQEESRDSKMSPKRCHQRRTPSADDSSQDVSPPTMEKMEEFSAVHRHPPKPSHSDLEQNTGFGYAEGAQKEWSSDGDGRFGCTPKSLTQMHPEGNVESLQSLYNQYIEVMYTNKANLQHTIMVQQNLFQQQLAKRNLVKFRSGENNEEPVGKQTPSSSPRSSPKHITSGAAAPGLALTASPSLALNYRNKVQPVSVATGSEVQMEWVVKRRADGSRYITRRPIRNRILKERARKLAEERCGLTTDDDAMSELKVGRYWSKEERKRHLEKARDHRRQKEMLLRQQMENAKENHEARKEGNIVELSHWENVRHKGKKTPDDASTVQELVRHRSRDVHGKAYNPLLSVTTV